MKKMYKIPVVFLFAGYHFIKLFDNIIRPLKNIPTPDFNNEYDSTML